MPPILAISAVSCGAVLVIVFLVAKRIRRSRALAAKAPQRRFTLHAQEFFEAGEFRTPRPLRLEQEIFKQKPRRTLSEITFPSKPAAPQSSAQLHGAVAAKGPKSSLAPIPIRPSAGYTTLFGESVLVNQIDSGSKPAASAPSEPAAIIGLPVPSTLNDSFLSQRMPPQPERPFVPRNGLGLSRASQDAGDAFHHPLRGSGTMGPVPSRSPVS